MDDLILEQKCGVSFQTHDPIKFNAAYGQYPGSGMTWVSWPAGRFRLYKDHVEVYGLLVENENASDLVPGIKKLINGQAFGTLKIPFGKVVRMYKKEGVIIMEHADTTIPKHIWVATLFTGLFWKKIQKVVLENDIHLILDDEKAGKDIRSRFDRMFKILLIISAVIVAVVAILVLYFFFTTIQ